MKIKFSEAWKIWRSGGKTMLGEPITIWTLLTIILSALIEGTVHFFAVTMWKKFWDGKNKKDR